MSDENSDVHLLTAYALGELHGDQKERIEKMIQADPILKKSVEEIRLTAGMLIDDLKVPPEVSLSSVEKSKLEAGWRELAKNESSSSFLKQFFGPLPAFAAAAIAVIIVVAVSLPNFEKAPKQIQRQPIGDELPAVQSEVLAPKDSASGAKTAPLPENESDGDRIAHFVKIEKKEVNAEVAAKTDDSKEGATSARGALGGFPQKKSVSAAQNVPAAAPASKGKAARPISVLFGGDGEQVIGIPDSLSVKERLRTATNEFTACYSNALKGQPSLRGKMILKWRVTKDRATGVVLVNSTANLANKSANNSVTRNSQLESCLIKTIKNLHFGPETNGATVVMPFHFAAQ